MKYEVFTVSCGIEKTLLKTDSIHAVRAAYLRIVNKQGFARVRVNGRTLPIIEADRLMGRQRAGIV